MSALTEYQKLLALYLKDNGFSADDTIAVCLCCNTDTQAKAMLDYCKSCDELDLSEILEKAVELSENL